MSNSLYQQLKKAGCRLENHESDLYVKVDSVSRAIVNQWKDDNPDNQLNAGLFISAIDESLWYELPFNHEPFWQGQSKK